ncbi:unnamed protein product [Rotaria sordida]|uniref:G domain-containing protein n=3 Tax=Rotaria sordida TaxID=392033 RepID=A0A814VEV1_9BILA|nr:unnamed protein product [Rotaria sordida]CAF1188079.1 unnamed protein product [Rotaria sordida]CAF1437408.1 unnamed protein product [Rotaria sordida]CAF3596504.1 unnamed protein product [Rotaria sordida]CAF4052506.1 unnamed protein product [Rotaria sordida]
MTSTMMNNNKSSSTLPESMQRMITPHYEQIVNEIENIYHHPDIGLVTIARWLGLSIMAPNKKISILLIGNHSAGKSSLVNWYIEDNVQRTGVAIETQGKSIRIKSSLVITTFVFTGISIITSGKRRESLMGPATMRLFPYLDPLGNIPGLLNYLTTEISSSKQKKFPIVSFIDTPGLVDGAMAYPFDVEQAILWLGNHVDLIFVLFDPIGQALCKRTLTLVEQLNKSNPEKMHYYLAKADEAGSDRDRHRVLMQIVQNLCRQPEISKTNFDMPTIYLPDLAKETRCTNQIHEVCSTIDHAVFSGVQKSLNTLHNDCKRLEECINERLVLHEKTQVKHRSWSIKLSIVQFISLLLVILSFILLLRRYLETSHLKIPIVFLDESSTSWQINSTLNSIDDFLFYPAYSLLLLIIFVNGLIFFIGRFIKNRQKDVLNAREKKMFIAFKHHLETNVGVKQKNLYESFLAEAID